MIYKYGSGRHYVQTSAKQQFGLAVASLGFEDTVIKAMIDRQNELERKANLKANELCSGCSERPKKTYEKIIYSMT